MPDHIVIDLEALSTRPTAAIIAIGAVKLNNDLEVIGEFYSAVDIESSLRAGLTVDGDTIGWWLQQNKEAVHAITYSPKELKDVLKALTVWATCERSELEVWGNGPEFDNVVLANAYHACDLKPFWPFFCNRSLRELRRLYGNFAVKPEPAIPHHALEDARAQAESLRDLLTLHRRLTGLPTITAGGEDVLRERAKQMSRWGAKHDAMHGKQELTCAAMYYACPDHVPYQQDLFEHTGWGLQHANKAGDVRENLIRAAALLMAKIDRIDATTNQQE